MKNKDILILGAGFAGLSSALALIRLGYLVKVIELGSKPGGIGAEIIINGHKFEMGPHLFHAPDPQIMNDIKNLIKEELVPVTRTIKIKFMGDYYNYPLSIVEVLLKLPKLVVLSALISFLYHYTKSFFYNVKSPNSETVLIQNYGKVLYRIFFESYIDDFPNRIKINNMNKKNNLIINITDYREMNFEDLSIFDPRDIEK